MSIADKLTTVAENVPKVYEAGQKSEYDSFWDDYQSKGSRVDYSYMFASFGTDCFYPKYNMRPETAFSMFQNFGVRTLNQSQIDLQSRLEECGIMLDFSKCTDMNSTFNNTNIKSIGVVNTTSVSAFTQTFYNARFLVTVEELVFKNDGTQTFNLIFDYAMSLRNIKISGVIGSTLSMASCPLTVESAKSVINALKNYAGTTNELTYKLTLNSNCWTALNEAETPPNGDTWQDYVETLGWSVA